ncbi:hypothetical protein MTO96_039213 [Rhipicephalus appendiculatus]
MDTMRYMITVLYIACGVLYHVYALGTAQWQCHRRSFGGANGYCFSGLCEADENHHHALKRKKRSLKHYLVGFFLGRRVGLRQGSRPSIFQRFGRR